MGVPNVTDLEDVCDDTAWLRGRSEPARKPHASLKYWLSTIAVQATVLITLFALSNALYGYDPLRDTTGRRSWESEEIAALRSPPSVFNHFIQPQTINGIELEQQKYFGLPSEASELAWDELLTPRSFRLHPNEAEWMGITESIRLKPDGEDLVVITGVKHNLHCLRTLRQAMYPEIYYADMTTEAYEKHKEHNLHCLELLRTSMICNPDLALFPYSPRDNVSDSRPIMSITRNCLNWEALHDDTKHNRRYYRDDLL